MKSFFFCALRMNTLSIFSVISKSAITPSLSGLIAAMWSGVFPNIVFASAPTAYTLPLD